MSLHRVQLQGGAARDTFDPAAVRAYSKGELGLREALGVGEDAIGAMRRQAQAYFHTGRFGECVDVLLGLGVLEDVEARDAAMLAEAFYALGDEQSARRCALLYEEILDAVEDTLREMEVQS